MPTDPPDALLVLVRRAEAGVAGSLAELRTEFPGLMPWADLERLAQEAREAWAAAAADGRADRAAARLRALDRDAARLARPGAGRLEVLLAGRAALAADVLRHARQVVARGPGRGSPAVPARLERRVAAAAREHAAAERMLAALQQLLDVPEAPPRAAGTGPRPCGDESERPPPG